MIFDYLRTTQSLDSISIADIGNTCLNAINDDAWEWYLIIETTNGWTKTTTFGPLKVDSDSLLSNFSYNFYEREFSEKNISSTISNFINNPKHMITQVVELDKNSCKDRFDFIKQKL